MLATSLVFSSGEEAIEQTASERMGNNYKDAKEFNFTFNVRIWP